MGWKIGRNVRDDCRSYFSMYKNGFNEMEAVYEENICNEVRNG